MTVLKASHASAKQGQFLIVVIENGRITFHGKVEREITDLVEELNGMGAEQDSEAFFVLACRAAVAVDTYGDYGHGDPDPCTIPDDAKSLEFPMYWSVIC